MIDNIFDTHMHSDNSPDAKHSVTLMCEVAIDKGIRGICITDHCEIDGYEKNNHHLTVRQSAFETVKAKSLFLQSLMVALGIEIGQPLHDPALAEKIIGEYEFDFVLASIHSLRDGKDFAFIDYGKENAAQCLRSYFSELLELVQWGKFDALAHLTYPLRYGVSVDMGQFSGMIDEVLALVVEKGKGIELNTAAFGSGNGYFTPSNEFFPSFEIIKRYKELGGQIVTIGSDAHKKEDVGAGIVQGLDLLRQAGFNQVAFYMKREPVMMPI